VAGDVVETRFVRQLFWGGYEAVIASRTRLHESFCVGDSWPPETMSVEDNQRDLEWHADELKRRSSFTYTVIDPEMSGCAGCVYVYPPTRVGYDVELFMWLRSDRYSTDREVDFRRQRSDLVAGSQRSQRVVPFTPPQRISLV